MTAIMLPLFDTRSSPSIDAPTIPLRDYQEAAVSAILSSWEGGKDRILLVLPTGTGKTVVFSEVIKRRLNLGPALILAHRDELIEQAVHKYQMVHPGADIGVVKAERNELGHDVTVASVQTVSQPKRLASLGLIDFATVVVDEAHHSTATTYIAILQAIGAFAGRCKVLGVTATPNRSDKIGLGNVFEAIVYEEKMIEMIRRGYLCDLKAERVSVPIDLSRIKSSHGDYQQGDLDRAMYEVEAEKIIARGVAAVARDRKKIIAFTPAVRSAHALSKELTALDIPAGVVDGKTPIHERRHTLSEFSTGKKQAISNCGVLTEGYDEPQVDCIVIARPTKSALLYQQMIGRGTRTAPGKSDCLIVDLVGATRDHKLMTISSLTGMPLTKKEQDAIPGNGGGGSSGDGADLAMSLIDVMRAFGTIVDGDGNIVSSSVDILGNSWAQWIAQGGIWILPADKLAYVLEPNARGEWNVWEKDRDGRRLIAKQMDLGYAQGVAEERARKRSEVLTAKDARWRSLEITDGQANMLKKLRLDPLQYANRGQASDAISVKLAMRGWY